MIINLIQNALEAMQDIPNPKLTIIAGKNDSDHVQISISDNGKGIKNEELERIFLPFFFTKANNWDRFESVATIKMLDHSRLEVISDVREGATFKMIF